MSGERLAELFRRHGPAVVLTGAGISTERSGRRQDQWGAGETLAALVRAVA